MADEKKPLVGGRKVQLDRETALALLLGFAIAAYLKVDPQLYFGLGFFLTGKHVASMWGNAKEHQAKKPVEAAQ